MLCQETIQSFHLQHFWKIFKKFCSWKKSYLPEMKEKLKLLFNK